MPFRSHDRLRVELAGCLFVSLSLFYPPFLVIGRHVRGKRSEQAETEESGAIAPDRGTWNVSGEPPVHRVDLVAPAHSIHPAAPSQPRQPNGVI